MSEPVKTRRYRSTVREKRARANREAILQAARRRFLADGYPRTSVASVAVEAGVSEDLVYLLFKNKRGLLVEVLNFTVTGEVDSPRVLEQQRPLAVRDEKNQRRQIAMFAHDIAHRVDRARPIDDVMRSAAEVDEAVAEKYRSMQTTRLANLTQFVRWVTANGPLRDGLSVDEAAATVWALAGPDMHRMLVDGLGWDIARYAEWLRRTLEAALLPPAED
jgi:AcrR family transcriptional regulator